MREEEGAWLGASLPAAIVLTVREAVGVAAAVVAAVATCCVSCSCSSPHPASPAGHSAGAPSTDCFSAQPLVPPLDAAVAAAADAADSSTTPSTRPLCFGSPSDGVSLSAREDWRSTAFARFPPVLPTPARPAPPPAAVPFTSCAEVPIGAVKRPTVGLTLFAAWLAGLTPNPPARFPPPTPPPAAAPAAGVPVACACSPPPAAAPLLPCHADACLTAAATAAAVAVAVFLAVRSWAKAEEEREGEAGGLDSLAGGAVLG